MTEFIPPQISLSESLAQIERWAYEPLTEKVDGKKKEVRGPDGKVIRVPVPSKVKEFLEALCEDMNPDDWLKLAEGYKEIALGKAFEKKRQRGRPPGPDYGLGSTERARKERERARAAGVWHTKYPDGCTECGRNDYRHASGGICSRCRQILRDAGISISEYRKLKVEAKKAVT